MGDVRINSDNYAGRSRPSLYATIEELRALAPLPLGFGCSSLLEDRSVAEAERVLADALDAGVRYFDTARSYGYGAAEGVLGAALAGRRDQVVVASKAGILPPTLLDRARVKAMNRLMGRTGEAHARGGVFSARSLRRSVETSLRELQTDYLDIFLLHDCTAADLTDDVATLLTDLRTEGKIRAYGVATHAEDAAAIVKSRGWAAGIVQGPAFQGLTGGASTELMITHSVLRPHLASETGAGSTAEAVERLLRQAVAENPEGIVLFSSSSRRSMDANVALARSLPRPR